MKKTIEEIRIELDKVFKESSDQAIIAMTNMQEEIVIAFCAKYGLHPEECISCYQDNKFWVEKRSDEHIAKITKGRHKSIDSLLEINKKLLSFIKEFHKNPSDDFIIKAKDLLKEIGELDV